MSKHPFVYQAPTPQQVQMLERLRNDYRVMYAALMTLPSGRERSLAITKLEESNMWANKGIVMGEDEGLIETLGGKAEYSSRPLRLNPVMGRAGTSGAPVTSRSEEISMSDGIPRVGDLVLFRLDSGNNPGEYRPAFIVRTWGATPEAVVNLQVLTDETNDGLLPTAWVTSRKHGEGRGEWLWPFEVESLVAA